MQICKPIQNNRDNSTIFQKTTANKKQQGKTHITTKNKPSNLTALKGYCRTIDIWIKMVTTRPQKEKRVIELMNRANRLGK